MKREMTYSEVMVIARGCRERAMWERNNMKVKELVKRINDILMFGISEEDIESNNGRYIYKVGEDIEISLNESNKLLAYNGITRYNHIIDNIYDMEHLINRVTGLTI